MNIDFKNAPEDEDFKNPELDLVVDKDSELKEWLVEYVGNRANPENNEVTVEMVIETVADEFPEFILAMAEENWIRGYEQALLDVDSGRMAKQQDDQADELDAARKTVEQMKDVEKT